MQDFQSEDKNKGTFSWINNINPYFYVIIVLCIIFFLYQIIGGSIAVLAGGVKLEGDVNTMRIILAFGQFMFILAPTLFFTRLQTADLKGALRLHIPQFNLILLAILGIVLIQPIIQGYMFFQDYTLQHIPFLKSTLKQLKDLFDTLESAELKIIKAYSLIEFLVITFVICITPAVCEELLFRGFVLSNIKKLSKATVAIFITAILFALYHFQPFNIVPLILLGSFLGFVVYYSNSIFLGMFVHFLNNFIASYVLYIYNTTDINTPKITGKEGMDTMAIGLISALLFIFVIYLFYKFRTKSIEEAKN